MAPIRIIIADVTTYEPDEVASIKDDHMLEHLPPTAAKLLARAKECSEGMNAECHEEDEETEHGRGVCPPHPVISSPVRASV